VEKSDDDFVVLFEHGSMQGIVFAPGETDGQEPHIQDEIYLVIRGSREFELEGKVAVIGVGDFLFVPAGAGHRFRNFTADLLLWVIFYGEDEEEIE